MQFRKPLTGRPITGSVEARKSKTKMSSKKEYGLASCRQKRASRRLSSGGAPPALGFESLSLYANEVLPRLAEPAK